MHEETSLESKDYDLYKCLEKNPEINELDEHSHKKSKSTQFCLAHLKNHKPDDDLKKCPKVKQNIESYVWVSQAMARIKLDAAKKQYGGNAAVFLENANNMVEMLEKFDDIIKHKRMIPFPLMIKKGIENAKIVLCL